jgi:hypothetical protein
MRIKEVMRIQVEEEEEEEEKGVGIIMRVVGTVLLTWRHCTHVVSAGRGGRKSGSGSWEVLCLTTAAYMAHSRQQVAS